MQRNLIVALFLSALVVSCRSHEPATRNIDLTQHLAYTELVPDSQVILFGTQEARGFLISGWSTPEKHGGETFQWAVEPNAVLTFRTLHRGPLYLHVRTASFFPNSAEVFVNHHSIGTIHSAREADTSTLLVPDSALEPQTNALEFRFAELRASENKSDPRKLAAAFYSAVITPSKYVAKIPSTYPRQDLWKTDTVQFGGKRWKALTSSTGLSWYLHEKLTPGAVLRFGTYYRPSPLAEEDDFAAFSVYIRRDGATEKEIFSRRFTAPAGERVELALAPYVSGQADGITEVELRLERNSIFGGGMTAWMDPSLSKQDDLPAAPGVSSQLEELRRGNRGANVIIMLLDAGGAKHFSSYGYYRHTTPVIDALARESIRFTHAYTQAVYTLASTASLMSGLDPLHHRIITRRSRLPAESQTLAERFDDAGYSTGTFVSNGNASSIFGMTQGFEEVSEAFRDPNYSGWGMDITNHFTAWLDRNPRRPFFAYLHYREPHGPFNPPPQFKFQYTDPNYHGIAAQQDVRRAINFGEIPYTQADKDYITALYDANLNYGDFEVGRVLKKLKDLGIYDNTVVIVTADHGEAFWEHDFQGHNSQLYEESVHIPLILKLTRRSNLSGKTVDDFVRTIDYYPTLVDLMDFTRRGMKGDGRSFLPYLASAPDDGRPVITQTVLEQQYSYREGDYKYIVRLSNRDEELYNLQKDPGEKNNLFDKEPVRGRYYRSRMMGWLAESRRLNAFQKGERAVMDETTRENLKTLGYVDE